MLDEKKSKMFLLGCLYGFEKDNETQFLEFNCTKINYLIDLTVLLRTLNIPFHLEKEGLRLLVVTDTISKFDSFLKENYNIDYTFPLKIKWPDFLKISSNEVIPFVDGIFETAGMFNSMNSDFPFVLHLQSEKMIQKISSIVEYHGIENIWIKNPVIKSLCTLQIMNGKKFISVFLKTNKNSKYSNLFEK